MLGYTYSSLSDYNYDLLQNLHRTEHFISIIIINHFIYPVYISFRKSLLQYIVEHSHCVIMFSSIFFGIFLLSAILTQYAGRFDWLREARTTKVASGLCFPRK